LIRSFRHRGVRAFFETGSTRGIVAAHRKRLARQLFVLNHAASPADVDVPGWRLHPLHGDLKGHWSISVSGNWRLTFRFDGTDVVLLDYLDYH